MSAQSAVFAGRAAAAEQMTDTFTAYTFTTTQVDGLDTQTRVAGDTTPGKVPNNVSVGPATSARTIAIGGVQHIVIEGGLHLPWSASPVVGMEYELTTLGPTSHPSMLGNRYRVIETHPTSAMTAWRLDVVNVTPVEA